MIYAQTHSLLTLSGIRRVLEQVMQEPLPRSSLIPKRLIRSIRMGTTVATNGKSSG